MKTRTSIIKAQSYQCGYTLIELLIVLALIGLAASMSVLSIRGGSDRVVLQGAAQELVAGLRRTQSAAIRDNTPAVLEMDVAQRRYRGAGAARDGRLPDSIEVTLTAAASERTDVNRAAIRFFPDGSSTGGEIVLSAGELNTIIEVDWLTGQVSVQ